MFVGPQSSPSAPSDLDRDHHHSHISPMLSLKRSPVILRGYHSTAANIPKPVIGIRKEDPSRIWERRAPLTPDAVHHLVKSTGMDVLIQDCERRSFRTSDYVKAGACVHETLEPAHIVLGIKETPIDQALTSPVLSPWTHKPVPRTHLMFSHTIKGQPYNMQLLSKFLAAPSLSDPHLLPRLIDYELLTDDTGKRTVGFGWFAGGQFHVTVFVIPLLDVRIVAGALETLAALSQALLRQGVASPFLVRLNDRPTIAAIPSYPSCPAYAPTVHTPKFASNPKGFPGSGG